MPRWFLFSALAGFCWALWAILSKVVDAAHPTLAQVQLLFTAGLLPTALLSLARVKGVRAQLLSRGGGYGFVAGLLGALGNLAFYEALARGGLTAIVIPLTSLYPLVTLLVAWLFMRERIGAIQLVGAAAALIAVVLLSGEAGKLLGATATVDAGAASWMPFVLAALVAWGLLSAAQKVSTTTISSEVSFAAFSIAFVPVTAALLLGGGATVSLSGRVIAFGVAAGAANGFGMLASFAAYASDGKASIVTPLAGVLSSLFTVVLALAFLGERLGGWELGGVVAAIAAAAALSHEPL